MQINKNILLEHTARSFANNRKLNWLDIASTIPINLMLQTESSKGYYMIEDERINWVNGIFEDGEWISWDSIGEEIDDEDAWDLDDSTITSDLNTIPSTLKLRELLDELIESARNYLEITHRHLPVYGELGELFGEIKYGIKRHKPNTQGSDGKIGDDFVEIKTISPHKSKSTVSVKRAGNFNKLLIVKISEDFTIKSKMIDRKDLNKGNGKYAKVLWKEYE